MKKKKKKSMMLEVMLPSLGGSGQSVMGAVS